MIWLLLAGLIFAFAVVAFSGSWDHMGWGADYDYEDGYDFTDSFYGDDSSDYD